MLREELGPRYSFVVSHKLAFTRRCCSVDQRGFQDIGCLNSRRRDQNCCQTDDYAGELHDHGTRRLEVVPGKVVRGANGADMRQAAQ